MNGARCLVRLLLRVVYFLWKVKDSDNVKPNVTHILTNIEIKTRHFRPMWVVYFIVNEPGKIKDI